MLVHRGGAQWRGRIEQGCARDGRSKRFRLAESAVASSSHKYIVKAAEVN